MGKSCTDGDSLCLSLQPPEWIDSDVCMRCRTPFSFTNRKHHCRNCGNVFCQSCSSKRVALPDLGIVVPVRVDDGCFDKIPDPNRLTISAPILQQPHHHTNTWQRSARFSSSMQPRDARVDENFDQDLKRALEMSLDEVKGHSGSGFVPQSQLQSHRHHTSTYAKPTMPKVVEEEEDADLKAAIAASMADMEEQKKQHAVALQKQTARGSNAAVSTGLVSPNSKYELTPMEAENINLFSTLVDRLQNQPPGTVLREPQMQELYESIGQLRPKLARTYGETMSKHGRAPLYPYTADPANIFRYSAGSSCKALNCGTIL